MRFLSNNGPGNAVTSSGGAVNLNSGGTAPAAGTLMFLQLGSAARNTNAVPSGWTLISSIQNVANTAFMDLYYKVANGSETAVTYSYASSTTHVWSTRLYAVPLSFNFHSVAHTITTVSGTSTTYALTGSLVNPVDRQIYFGFFGSGTAPQFQFNTDDGRAYNTNANPGGASGSICSFQVDLTEQIGPNPTAAFGVHDGGGANMGTPIGVWLDCEEAVAPYNGEVYTAFCFHLGAVPAYSSTAPGTWTASETNRSSVVDVVVASQLATGGALSTDLPTITVTYAAGTVAGYCVMVAAGKECGTLTQSRTWSAGNSGVGATVGWASNTNTSSPPVDGSICLLGIAVKGGTPTSVPFGASSSAGTDDGFILLTSSYDATSDTTVYVYAKLHANGLHSDVTLQQVETRIAATAFVAGAGVAYLDPGALPYIIDEGQMIASGSTLAFTATKHGPVTPPSGPPSYPARMRRS